MAASQISPHHAGAEELKSCSPWQVSLNICSRGNSRLVTQRLGVPLLLLLSEVWGTQKGPPDFDEREVRLIANIPAKLTPYVKELGIRWLGTSKCFQQAWQRETRLTGLFCEVVNYFHQVFRGGRICKIMWWGGKAAGCTASSRGPDCRGSTKGVLQFPLFFSALHFASPKGITDLNKVTRADVPY